MRYSGLKKYSIGNGEGIRVSLYVSGCKFHCKGCFNPETWDYEYGELYTKETEEEIFCALYAFKISSTRKTKPTAGDSFPKLPSKLSYLPPLTMASPTP